MVYRFGNCVVDTDRYELQVNGERQAIEPQVLRLLMYFIESRDRVVTRDELIDTIWQGRMVSDSTLASRIRSVRHAIGDSGERQAFIQTVHGSGYRFVGEVRAVSAERRESQGAREADSEPEADPIKPLATRLVDWCDRGRQVVVCRSPRQRWYAALLMVGLMGVGMTVWRVFPTATPAGVLSHRSIAVLPFADMSMAGDQEYFADGVAEEILNALSKVEGLRVVGRTSAFSFKGKNADLKTIGEQLKVSAVLEGSIRRVQDRVRITIQLVDTSNGYHLWSEAYDRQMQDIFAIQDDIARAVVHRLNIGFEAEDTSRPLVVQETRNVEVLSPLSARTLFVEAALWQ